MASAVVRPLLLDGVTGSLLLDLVLSGTEAWAAGISEETAATTGAGAGAAGAEAVPA